jgi:hypothetical protein
MMLLVVRNSESGLDGPTGDQRGWLVRSEERWREAYAIAAANPSLDAGDVYHALTCLDLSPAERLHRGLTRVRRRPHCG